VVDGNHPLAGLTLHYRVHVRDVREATAEEIARAARELVASYGADAAALMRKRTRAIRRRGDAESASLWIAVARAVEEQLAAGDTRGGRRADGA
jgi:hypothetical protein